MNLQQAMGKWRQLKGKARAAWGRALKDRGKQAAGAAEELAGVIQEKSADAKQAMDATAAQLGEGAKLDEAEIKTGPAASLSVGEEAEVSLVDLSELESAALETKTNA